MLPDDEMQALAVVVWLALVDIAKDAAGAKATIDGGNELESPNQCERAGHPAEKYQVSELSHLCDNFTTWHDICKNALYDKRPAPEKAPRTIVRHD